MYGEKRSEAAASSRKNLSAKLLFLALAIVALGALLAVRNRLPSDSDNFESQTPVLSGEYTLLRDKPSEYRPGKAAMIVFFDFYCPHCRDFDSGVVASLRDKYGGRLEITFVGYPIFGDKAMNAIRAYELAKEFEKGDEMKAAIFYAYHDQRQDISDTAVLASVAFQVGLEGDEFKKALDDGAKIDAVNSNVRLAESYKVRQTPTVVLNGNLVVTQITFENIDEIISQLTRT